MSGFEDVYLLQVIELLKDRVTFVADYFEHGAEFFAAPQTYDEAVKAKCWKPETAENVRLLCDKLVSLSLLDAASVERTLRECAVERNVGAGALIQPMRLALAGVSQGANLFAMIAILGKEEVARRVAKACEIFG